MQVQTKKEHKQQLINVFQTHTLIFSEEMSLWLCSVQNWEKQYLSSLNRFNSWKLVTGTAAAPLEEGEMVCGHSKDFTLLHHEMLNLWGDVDLRVTHKNPDFKTIDNLNQNSGSYTKRTK